MQVPSRGDRIRLAIMTVLVLGLNGLTIMDIVDLSKEQLAWIDSFITAVVLLFFAVFTKGSDVHNP